MARSRRKGETSGYFEDGRVRAEVRYALILDDVLHSAAFLALPDYAVRVLLVLAAKFGGYNNGDLSLTAAVAFKEYGIAEWKLRAGLAVLKHVGLIEVTRIGKILNGKGICALYALGWRQIDPSDKYDISTVVATQAPNGWVKWQKPANWDQLLAEFRDGAKGKRTTWAQAIKKAHLTRGEQAAPHGGGETRRYRTPRVRQERQVTAPHVGETSQNSGSSLRGSRPGSALGQQLADLKLADCIAVARQHPDLGAADLATRCRTDEATAHRALQQLQAGASP